MDFLLGTWVGETNTWFDPTGEAKPGTIKTSFQKIVGGLFIEEVYSGTVGEKSHEGRRIFGSDQKAQETTCYWLDTFHTGATAMLCRGSSNPQLISVEGHYYGGEEKWGWRIEFRRLAAEKLEMKHYNIWPSGQVDLAIASTLTRLSEN